MTASAAFPAGFKPYVHSDCGGDYRSADGGDLLRWVAHCTMGTILRLHGADHRPWTYGAQVEDQLRSWLQVCVMDVCMCDRVRVFVTICSALHGYP